MTPTSEQGGPIARAKAEAIRSAGQMARIALQGELQPGHLVYSIPPSRSHILWLTGHIAYVIDALSALASGAPPALAEYAPLFGRGSQPAPEAQAYPPLGELLAALDKAIELAEARARSLGDEEMARKIPEELPIAKRFPTVGDVLTGVVVHTAYHSGQIALLRRAQGLASGLGV